MLREADTLHGLGFGVLVAGVVSTDEPDRRLRMGKTDIVRLAPSGWLRRGRAGPSGPPVPISASGGRVRQSPALSRPSRPRRLSVTLMYYLQGVRLVLRIRPALVHANDYNTMWIGVAAKLLVGSRLVYDCHELWPDRNGRPEWRPWLLACEALFVRLADTVITTSPGYAEVISGRYRVPPPVVVRNIPARVAHSQPGGSEPASPRALGVYVGGLMPGRGLEQAVRALAQTEHTSLCLIGPGREEYRRQLSALAARAGVADRVELRGALPPDRLLEAISDADFGLLLIQPVCLSYELTLPNKLFEYAAAGLPMLASDLPVIARVMRDHGLGEVVAPDDLRGIARAMQRLGRPDTEMRARVRAFASEMTWDRERRTLQAVYLGGGQSEAARVERAYAAYASSPGKRRSWSSENPGNAAIRAELVAAVDSLAGPDLINARRILDAGSGTGWWLEHLAGDDRITAELHGVELMTARAALASQRVPRAVIVPGDIRELPFEDRSFEVVTLFTVLSSLEGSDGIRRAVAEARRVLRPGGTLLIWEPRVSNPFNRHTVFVSGSLLEEMLGGMRVVSAPTTVVPALARRLGGQTERLYPRLAGVRSLRTHRLVCAHE